MSDERNGKTATGISAGCGDVSGDDASGGEDSNGRHTIIVAGEVEDVDEVEDVQVERLVIGGDGKTRFASDDDRIRACEHALGYVFFNKNLLRTALTHSSSTSDKRMDNERLEFFGDAVLDLVVREYLFHNYPKHQEGDLTEAKSALVCRAALVRAARRLELKPFLSLGRGIGKRRSVPDSLLGNAYEAVVAAIYLDGGYQPARNFILASLGEEIPDAIDPANRENFKSTLQKVLQQRKRPLPSYRVLASTGPEHSRAFQIAVMVEGKELGRGAGSNKKAAEQEAARSALENMDACPDPEK